MEGTYPIIYLGQTMGQAVVKRQGLYWQMDCRCHITGQGMHHLVLTIGQTSRSLGTLVPENGGFVLRTKVAVKHLPEGAPSFRALAKHPPMTGIFVPLSPEEPFCYLSRLEEGFLQRRGETVGFFLPDAPDAT